MASSSLATDTEAGQGTPPVFYKLYSITDTLQIIHETFPAPTLGNSTPRISQAEHVPSSPPSASDPPIVPEASSQSSANESSQATDKENAPPPPASLPPQILELVASITSTLTTNFSINPPHTVQRLAELLLSPRQHYRTLPSYLHAVDRVVHVTSGANAFPLPPAIPDPSSAPILLNGTTPRDPLSISWSTPTQTQSASLGSDESLGGALLTPILWLNRNGTESHSPEVRTESTETIEGPNGPGGIETVSVSVNGISSTREIPQINGVTQGELLRQEQRAGVVPAAQLQQHKSDEEEESPHARGPEEVGMQDMGPQAASSVVHGRGIMEIDVEAAVGRRNVEHVEDVAENEMEEGEEGIDEGELAEQRVREGTPKRVAREEAEGEGEAKRLKETETSDETTSTAAEDDGSPETSSVMTMAVESSTVAESKVADSKDSTGDTDMETLEAAEKPDEPKIAEGESKVTEEVAIAV